MQTYGRVRLSWLEWPDTSTLYKGEQRFIAHFRPPLNDTRQTHRVAFVIKDLSHGQMLIERSSATDAVGDVAQTDLDRYYGLLSDALPSFSVAVALVLVDSLIPPRRDTRTARASRAAGDVCPLVEQALADRHLDQVYGINGAALLQRLRTFTRLEGMAIVDAVERYHALRRKETALTPEDALARTRLTAVKRTKDGELYVAGAGVSVRAIRRADIEATLDDLLRDHPDLTHDQVSAARAYRLSNEDEAEMAERAAWYWARRGDMSLVP